MLIQIIGSKPGAKLLGNVDHYCFINGASHLINQATSDTRISVVTGWNIVLRNSREREIVYSSLKGKRVNSVYFICFQNETIHLELIDTMNLFSDKIIRVPRSEKSSLELKHIKSKMMYVYSVLATPGVRFTEKIAYLIHVLRKHELKLSTGLFSAIYMLDIHPEAKIVISGIGFGKSIYHWGSENKLRGHYLNDFAFLRYICRYTELNKKIITTEPELCELFGFELFSEEVGI